MKESSGFIGTTEAARLLRVTSRRVVGLCNGGKLPGAVRLGRNWKIPTEAVKRYMKNAGIEVLEEPQPVRDLLPCAIGNTPRTARIAETSFEEMANTWRLNLEEMTSFVD